MHLESSGTQDSTRRVEVAQKGRNVLRQSVMCRAKASSAPPKLQASRLQVKEI